MRFIPTKVHGILDYGSGLLLILSPWLFGFATGGAAQIIPIAIGLMIITMSIFTDYEAGVVRSLSMPFHLTMDVIAGLFLAVSPWLFGFAELIFWPHLVFGLLEMGAGLFTMHSPTSNTVSNMQHSK
jgi:hypothetical protein